MSKNSPEEDLENIWLLNSNNGRKIEHPPDNRRKDSVAVIGIFPTVGIIKDQLISLYVSKHPFGTGNPCLA